jgi:glucose-1-phosphate thymidylyltransferase
MQSSIANRQSAIILARGVGSRMRREDPNAPLDAAQAAAADRGLKAMMPIGGRPFLDYLLSALADAGFDRAVLVVAPDHAAVREWYDAHPPVRIALEYAVQAEPRGTADAVLAIESFVGSESFAVMNGDNYYPAEALRAVRGTAEPCALLFERDALLAQSNIPPERIAAFALVTIDAVGYLASVDEKPAVVPPGNRPISMNLWRFDPGIFDACRRAPASPRGERELPYAVDYGIRHLGLRLRAKTLALPVFDVSQRADVANVAARLRGIDVRT